MKYLEYSKNKIQNPNKFKLTNKKSQILSKQVKSYSKSNSLLLLNSIDNWLLRIICYLFFCIWNLTSPNYVSLKIKKSPLRGDLEGLLSWAF